MKITKLDVHRNSASCSFCDKGELNKSGNGLVYPYETTYQIQREGSGTQANICDECLKELNLKVNRLSQTFEIGDLVAPIEGHGLRSACSAYPNAVVVSVDPFVLVSTEADMMWRDIKQEDFDFVSVISGKVLKKCLARLK